MAPQRILLWALAIIAVGIGAYVILTSSGGTEAPPSITLTSPTVGEAWETGSTHTISWVSVGVPETHKVAVSIRRIPPPPLQEEGQEFDPVIFTDLPNTGSVEWTISDMYPAGTYVLGLSAYESLPVTNPVSAESAEFRIAPPPLAQDLYPLYPGVEWETPRGETFSISTSTYSGTSVSSVPVTGTMKPDTIFSPFESYYAKKLSALGWKVDNFMAAGGHTGGQTGYRKGDELVLVRFSVLYRTVTETAPSECPCDVTLSLFSS